MALAHRISCILPVYNGERFLAEALDSVLAQSLPPFELIVVDDGSTDGTAGVVAAYGKRVHCLRQENAGAAAARNAGLALARGELIAFMDADDLWHQDKLALQVARLRARPDLQIVLAHLQNFWISELCEEAQAPAGQGLKTPRPGYVLQATLARRGVFDRVGRFDPALRMGEDTDWFARAQDARIPLGVMPEVLVYRRFHRGNTTRDYAARRAASLDVVHAALLRRRSAGRVG